MELWASRLHNRKNGAENEILFMGGGNVQRKGLKVLLQACSLVLEELPDIHVVIIGWDGTTCRLVSKFASAKVREKIELIEWVPNDRLPSHYAKATVFVLPSLIEAFGVAYLEAMACGTPVIGTRHGGCSEFITHGKNGLLIEPGDYVSLAENIIAVILDRNLQTSLATCANETVRTYSVGNMVKSLLTTYQDVISDMTYSA